MKMSPRLTNVARITACTDKLVKVRKNGQQKTCNLFCSNVAKQVARFCCPFFRTLSCARAQPLRNRAFHVEEIPHIQNRFDVREFKSFTYTANGKRQIQVEKMSS